MSASKQKKLRSNSDAVDKKVIAAQEKAAKDKKFRHTVIICVIIFAVLIAAAVFINSDYLSTNTTAVVVNGNKYSPAELNFYYNLAYNQFYEQYSSYISYLLDTTKPLNAQECTLTESGTWADYFTEQALVIMKESDILYNKAIAEGYTVEGEVYETAEANLEYIAAMATAYGYPSVDDYLQASYCKAMDSETYLEISAKYMLSSKYAGDNYDSFEYTNDQLAAYYAENADEYDTYSFNIYIINTSNSAYSELETAEEKLVAAEADAQALIAATTEEEFNAAAAVLSGTESVETKTVAIGQNLSNPYADWLKDASRVEGDIFTTSTETAVYVVRFISREDCNYNTVDVRHILIKAETAADGTGSTAEALGTAKAELDAIYEEWLANPTEENFIALANEHSDDTAADGLYEKVFKYEMVEEFNNFCFAEGRQPGDTAIVYGTNGSYEGYHLIYFVGENDLYSNIMADGMLRSTDYSAFLEEVTANCTSELKWASRFAELD